MQNRILLVDSFVRALKANLVSLNIAFSVGALLSPFEFTKDTFLMLGCFKSCEHFSSQILEVWLNTTRVRMLDLYTQVPLSLENKRCIVYFS